jgi:uncharacterized protein YjbI with pentapeptide repeats
MPVTSFQPATHGFEFSNSFDNNRFFGPIHINFGGRCGGMSYAALDYFNADIPIPTQTSLPTEGSVLSTYISGRQERATLNQIDRWIELTVNPFGARTSEFFQWGLQETGGGRAQQLKQEIDRGRPCILGLFNPTNLVVHHQVLAYGYEGSGGNLKLCIYDPNHPNREMVLRPRTDEQRFLYDGVDYGDPKNIKWLTYFVDLNYRVRRPPTHLDSATAPVRVLSDQNLSGQNLSNQDFRRALCIRTNFTGCTINQGDFERANLERACLRGANLRNSNFSSATLTSADLYGADLKDTRFLNAYARAAIFVGADMKLAQLSGASLESSDLHGADLHRCMLERSNLDHANLRGASLNTACLRDARLRGANLAGADLRAADLRGADFTGANLRGANLGGANRTGAIGLP